MKKLKAQENTKNKVTLRIISIGICLIILYSTASNFSSFSGEFVWDDRWLVLEGTTISEDSSVFSVFARDYFQGADPRLKYGYFRPMSALSFVLTKGTFGDDPFYYHLTNVLFHVGCSLLVFFLGLELRLSFFAALFGALLFAVHPVHVESVVWISGRTDVFATFFGMTTLLCFLLAIRKKYRKRRKILLFTAGTVIWIFAVLSKEVALVVPLIFILLALGNKRKNIRWRALILALVPCAILGVVYIFLRVFIVSLPNSEIGGISWSVKTLSAISGVARYFFLFLAPIPQRPYMQTPMIYDVFQPVVLIGVVLIIGTIVLWRRRQKTQWHGAVLATCFVVSLLPMLNFVRITSPQDMGFTMAERFLYFPSIFLCLILGTLFFYLYEKLRETAQKILIVFALGTLCFLGWINFERGKIWENELNLFSHMIETAPEAPLPRVLLSQALRRAGRTQEATREAERARRLYQQIGDVPPTALQVTLAGALMAEGRLEEAALLLEDSGVQRLDSPKVHRDLATVYRLLGRLDEAHEQLERAAELVPEDPKTWLYFTLLYLQMENLDRATEASERARRLNPNDPAAHHAAALVSRANGNLEEAKGHLRRALDTQAEVSAQILTDLGVLLSETGEHNEAISTLRRAVELEPGSHQSQHALAVAYLRAGQAQRGIEVLEGILENHPEDVRVLVTLARARLSLGQRREAFRLFQNAERVNPGYRGLRRLRRELGHE